MLSMIDGLMPASASSQLDCGTANYIENGQLPSSHPALTNLTLHEKKTHLGVSGRSILLSAV